MSSSSSDLISDQFNQQLSLDPELNQHDENDKHDENDDNDDDFTFMLIGEDDLPIYSDEVTADGQIRQVFPLFDQKLLLNDGEYDVEEIHQLPIHPPVDKIFIESPRGFPSVPVPENEQNDDLAAGPYCAWSKDTVTLNAELSKKSNSTGFSKLWRLREKVNRSNSDGRDAFVFLKNSDRVTPSSSSSVKQVNGNGNGKVKVVKAKKATVSAHEAYLKSKNGGHTEEERRRTYLPYRPELMGFFTNVHSGLSKNVHPY